MRYRILCALVAIVTQGATLNLSTNAAGAGNNQLDLSGWQVVGTPGLVDGAGSGALGAAVALAHNLSLGSAQSPNAGWISAGLDFGQFLHSQPGAANGDSQRNNVGVYTFARTFTTEFSAVLSYQFAGNDLVRMQLFSGNSELASYSHDSSSAFSPMRAFGLSPGVYTLVVEVVNLPSGPSSNPLRYQSSPMGFIMEAQVQSAQETPEPVGAALVGGGLMAISLLGFRRRNRAGSAGAACVTLLACASVQAGTLTLIPDSTISFDSNPVAGVGYRVVNDGDLYWRPVGVTFDSQLPSIGVDFLYDFAPVAPNSVRELAYSAALSASCPWPKCGFLEITWDLATQPNTIISGVTMISFDQFLTDPDVDPGAVPVSSIDLSAPYAFTYAGPSVNDTPEPASFITCSLGLGLFGFRVWRSTHPPRSSPV